MTERKGMSLAENVQGLLQRAGLIIPSFRRSIWMHGDTPLQFDAAAHLIRAMMADAPHVRLVLTSSRTRTLEYLRSSFPDEQTLPAPWGSRLTVARWMAKLQVRSLVLLDGGKTLPEETLRLTVQSKIPIAAVNIESPGVLSQTLLSFCRRTGDSTRLCVVDASVARQLEGFGVPARNIFITGDSASARTLKTLSEIMPAQPSKPRVAQDWKIPSFRDKAGSGRLWRWIAPALMGGRANTWKQLQERLRHPRTVMCLGNGPSSEDPRLATLKYDCLIRVNWRWQRRGFLTDPQLVFVGDPATIHKVKGAIFGFWNESLEYGMLLRHLIMRGPAPMQYITMERISPLVRDQDWPDRPTNGALMIAAAAALQPERLIIGGVDLYLHPEGRYPGELTGINQYAHIHTRNTDLAIIRAALAEYRGDLIILGEALRAALEQPAGVTNA
jgi:3-Deoxy-D-manno-octulosonic-acid transferase (kdotransferase)